MVRLEAPSDFRLRPTVRSHGWSDLPPFHADARGARLTIRLDRTAVTVTQEDGVLSARMEPPAGEAELRAVRSCLRLDLDLSEFWAICRRDPELAWAARLRAGRFLRAPTAFADAAMMLATTNCSWALTRHIVTGLVECWGRNGAFPSRRRLARVPAAELRRRVPLGYRAPYLAALACGPDLEPLRTDSRPTAELRKRLLALPGFGPYAAENMLRLLGRFEHLAIDSWVKRRWKELHPRRKPTERAIASRFARFGRWRGLAFWLVLTRHWHERD